MRGKGVEGEKKVVKQEVLRWNELPPELKKKYDKNHPIF
jgi:hypothetical protein